MNLNLDVVIVIVVLIAIVIGFGYLFHIILSLNAKSNDILAEDNPCYKLNAENNKIVRLKTYEGCTKLITHLINNEGYVIHKYYDDEEVVLKK